MTYISERAILNSTVRTVHNKNINNLCSVHTSLFLKNVSPGVAQMSRISLWCETYDTSRQPGWHMPLRSNMLMIYSLQAKYQVYSKTSMFLLPRYIMCIFEYKFLTEAGQSNFSQPVSGKKMEMISMLLLCAAILKCLFENVMSSQILSGH